MAIERNRRRAGELMRTAARLRAGNVRVEIGDAARPSDGEAFDRVLVDPPCSGLGTLQARADLRWRVTPSSVAELAQVQAAILAAGAHVLRPGGVLVYRRARSPRRRMSTDRYLPGSYSDFMPRGSRLRRARICPGSSNRAPPSPDVAGHLTLPHRDRTAGFFIVRMRRSWVAVEGEH